MNWYSNLKISKKRIVQAFIIATVGAVFIVASVVSVMTLTRTDRELYSHAMELKYTGDASTVFQKVRLDVLELTTRDDAYNVQEPIAEINQYFTYITDNISLLKGVMGVDEQETLDAITRIDSTLAEYKSNLDETITYVNSNSFDEVSTIALNTLESLGEQLSDDFTELSQLEANQAKQKMDNNAAKSRMTFLLLGGIFILGSAILLPLSIKYTNSGKTTEKRIPITR